MRGIPKHIATKADVKNLCRDLPPAQAKKLLARMKKRDFKRLRISTVEQTDLVKMVAARQRVISRKRNELERARVALAAKQAELVTLKANEADMVRRIRKIELSQEEIPDYAGRIQTLKTGILRHETKMAESIKHAEILRIDRKRIDTTLARVNKEIDVYAGTIVAAQDRIALTRSEAERMQKDLEQLEILQQQAKDTHTAIQELERSIKRLEVKNG